MSTKKFLFVWKTFVSLRSKLQKGRFGEFLTAFLHFHQLLKQKTMLGTFEMLRKAKKARSRFCWWRTEATYVATVINSNIYNQKQLKPYRINTYALILVIWDKIKYPSLKQANISISCISAFTSWVNSATLTWCRRTSAHSVSCTNKPRKFSNRKLIFSYWYAIPMLIKIMNKSKKFQ